MYCRVYEVAGQLESKVNSEPRELKCLSIVVPCYNEEEVIEETNRRLVSDMTENLSDQFEIIYVDDGSADSTWQSLEAIRADDQRIKAISFSRNFGHQVAVTAGLEYAVGDVVAIIDADLQDPPEVILEMLSAWQGGVDVAYGVRAEREGESRFKLWRAAILEHGAAVQTDNGNSYRVSTAQIKSAKEY